MAVKHYKKKFPAKATETLSSSSYSTKLYNIITHS